MKRITSVFLASLAGLSAMAAVDIVPGDKTTSAKEMVSRSICGMEFSPSSRLWLSSECSIDGQTSFIALSYSDNGGNSWNDAVGVIKDDSGMSLSSATLWNSPSGELMLFFTARQAGTSESDGTLYVAVCSNPGGKQPEWSSPREIGTGYVTDKVVVSADGVWVLPYALWGGAGVYTSSNGGADWKRSDATVCPESLAPNRNDASLIKMPDGSLKMIVRGSDNVMTCQASEYVSRDNGSSWSKASKFIDNPDRRLSLTRLSDGRLLLVKNGYADQLCYIMPYNLVCYLSEDNGNTWYGEMRIASDRKSVNPYAVSDADGNILIAYDHDPEKTGEICLLTTSAREIESVYGKLEHDDVPGKTILKAGKCASFANGRIKTIFAPRKNWADKTLRIGTYNIQYRNAAWTEKRLPALEKLLAEYKFDIFGSQEPFITQIEDMMEMDFNGKKFGEVYSYVGRVVSDREGDNNHHYNPIFYRKDRIELLDWGLEWFTRKPGKPGYGAYSSRQCCWGHFRDKETGKEFYCFNSHPDHLGQEAREQSSNILVEAVARITGGLPTFLSGDFNAREDTPSYNILMESGFLDDALLSVYNPVNAEYFSMSHYKPMETVKKEGKHIDHIFYTPNSSKVISWELITHSYNNYFGSDHLPIICEWKIAN